MRGIQQFELHRREVAGVARMPIAGEQASVTHLLPGGRRSNRSDKYENLAVTPYCKLEPGITIANSESRI
jgi:hypothetical protein